MGEASFKSKAPLLPRGRISTWSRERLDKLSTAELRTLRENAERLKESEVAALCDEILGTRPRHRGPTRRHALGPLKGLVTRGKAFELHGVTPRNRVWSRGGLRTDGAVVLTLRVEEVQRAGVASECLLWGPNVENSRPWSDTPAGQERLEHCRMALERGTADGLLAYGGPSMNGAAGHIGGKAERVDAQTVLKLEVESRDGEYWARWTAR
jgi:hypothetical protein